MVSSPHFTRINGTDTISSNQLKQIHNLVETAKAFVKEDGRTSFGRTFHCTFVLKHGKVQTVGFNSYKRRIDFLPHFGKVMKYADANYHMGLHAEVNAILKLGQVDFSRMTFINVHLDKNISCKASKPCLNCYRMMRIVGVKNCMYFDEDKNKWLEMKI